MQSYDKIKENLAFVYGIPASNLIIVEPNPRILTLDFPHTSFLYEGIELARVFINPASENEIISARLFLPYESDSSQLYAPFNLDSIKDLRLERIRVDYNISEHPEFRELLKNLMSTKRIPKEKLHAHLELDIFDYRLDGLYGFMEYTFGRPKKNKPLCIEVDYVKGLKELVPEADEQKEQEHWCIHGETAPFIPFNPDKFSEISIGLKSTGDNRGNHYLNEFLDGLLVPADGLTIEGFYGSEAGRVKSKTPYYPTINNFEISMYKPESRDNWLNLIKLARRIEEMFKTK